MTRQFLDLLIVQLGLGQHFSGLFSNSTITTSHGRPSSSILSAACSWEPSRQSISEGDTPDRKTQAPLRQRILRRLHHLLNLHARELQLHQGRKSHELIHLHGNQPDTWHGYGHGRILPDQDTHRVTDSIARFIGRFHRPFPSPVSSAIFIGHFHRPFPSTGPVNFAPSDSQASSPLARTQRAEYGLQPTQRHYPCAGVRSL